MTAAEDLDRAVEHPAPHRDRVSTPAMLAALLLAPCAFSMQVIGSYVVAAETCSAGSDPKAFLVAINVLALLAAAAGFLIALSLWRRTRAEKAGDVHQAVQSGDGRTRFLALFALCTSTIFFAAVSLDMVAIAMLGKCL